MSVRKVTNSQLYLNSKDNIRKPIKVSKAQEDAFYESIKRERIERNANQFYEDKKYTLIPAIVIVGIISLPFIAIEKIYNYCRNKKIVHPEEEDFYTADDLKWNKHR